MSISSESVYNLLVQDLLLHLPNDPRVWDQTQVQKVVLQPNASLKQVRALSLAKAFFKKLLPSDANTLADEAAVQLFLKMNDRCADVVIDTSVDTQTLVAFTVARDMLAKWQTPELDYPVNVLQRGRFGPGASRNAKGDDFYSKSVCSPLTCTDPTMYDMYLSALVQSPTALRVEYYRRSKFGRASVIPGSKLSCVPKTSEISRTICTEPLLNMFLQQAVGSYLSDRLRALQIDIRTQQFVNRDLARIGSLTGDYCTIDLSSASDTISLKLCNSILPAALRDWLMFTRSPFTNVSGSEIELHMISSMGNGFTFPLQTMIFAAIVHGAYVALGLSTTRTKGEPMPYSVYGDDIIVRREAYGFVIHMLKTCGFIPNMDKSFSIGHFRESCGGDYYLGHPVRGCYIRSLATQQDRYSAINRLNAWSARSGIYLHRVVHYLSVRVRRRFVPPYEDITAGLMVPSSFLDSGSPFVYEALVARPVYLVCKEWSEDGLFQALLQGSYRDGRIGIRSDASMTKKRRRRVPCWDYFSAGYLSDLDSREREAWKQVTSTTLW